MSTRTWCLLLVMTSLACSRSGGTRVTRGDFSDSILLTGELKASKSLDVFVPPMPGQWQTQIRWMAPDGAPVHRGDKLLELDFSALAANALDQKGVATRARSEIEGQRFKNEEDLETSEMGLEQAQSALDKARVAAAVPPELLPRRDYEQRQLDLALAQANLEKAQASLKAAKEAARADLAIKTLALERAERTIGANEAAIQKMVVTAPEDGVVEVATHPWEGRKLQVGDSVWVGLTVLHLQDVSAMRVEARLFDVDEGRVRPGMAVTCSLDSDPDQVFKGLVTEVKRVAQPLETGSLRRAFGVTIALDRTDAARMHAGMSVRATVQTQLEKNVLLAPRRALDLSGARPLALLASGRRVPVELGPCSAQECVILSGLKEGQKLVALGGGP